MSKTYAIKPGDIKVEWHQFDATNQVLGRLATRVSTLLIGKHKPSFSSTMNMGDKVVVTNIEKLAFTGNKLLAKKYYSHSGYPGGLKEIDLKTLMKKSPEEVLKKAVWGMLPVNKLRRARILNLYIYQGDKHPHEGQLGK